MRYVYEFVDELDCGRCPHNAPADEESGWGDFDFVCLALEDGDESIFPEGCPAYLGPWGAWRSVLDLVTGLIGRIAFWQNEDGEYFEVDGWTREGEIILGVVGLSDVIVPGWPGLWECPGYYERWDAEDRAGCYHGRPCAVGWSP